MKLIFTPRRSTIEALLDEEIMTATKRLSDAEAALAKSEAPGLIHRVDDHLARQGAKTDVEAAQVRLRELESNRLLLKSSPEDFVTIELYDFLGT